jgi:hypothetical protein
LAKSLQRTRTFRGKTTVSVQREIAGGKKTPAGEAEPVSAPSQDAMRKHVEAGICPFCGYGPYKVLAGHTVRAHAVDAKELRRRCGLTYSKSITDPTYHKERAGISRRIFEEGLTLNTPAHKVGGKGGRKNLSPAAKELQRAKGAKAHQKHPDLQQRMKEASLKQREERMRPLLEQVVVVYTQVVAEMGNKKGAISETAKRLGWKEATTAYRIRAAWDLGLGSFERNQRSDAGKHKV